MIEPLGCYYTSSFVSDLLVSRFRQTSPGIVLDLGVGRGSLLTAAYKRWKDAEYYAVDIDRENISTSMTTFSFATFRHIDGLSPLLPQQINLKVGSIDVAVCNPPYLRIEKNMHIEHLLVDRKLWGQVFYLPFAGSLYFLKPPGNLPDLNSPICHLSSVFRARVTFLESIYEKLIHLPVPEFEI